MRHGNYKNENTEETISWYDWLIKYIPEIAKNTVASFKDNFVNLLRTNIIENYSKPTGAKNMHKSHKIIKTIESKRIKDIRNLLEHEEKDYYKPEKVDKFYSVNFIIHDRRDSKNKALSIE